ncbi:MAG TPA: nickel-dependent hydrogenase large subunit [Methanocella sp.]|nr:nickel-dependent hydrogenase large subunit [Methanocella sp.]
MVRITVDPVSRASGGLRFDVDLKDGSVADARCSGTSYRGFEQMLVGRDPLDAVYFTQRVCGMCSAAHATAAAGAVESLCGVAAQVPKDALVVRNILNGLAWLRSHVESLYLSFLPDLADPFYGDILRYSDTGSALVYELYRRFNAPGYAASSATAAGAAYADAVRCIKLIGETEAVLAGRSPHGPAIVPGGVTARPTASDLYRLKANYAAIVDFLERRLTAPLTLDQWLERTHVVAADPNYILETVSGLPKGDLSAEKGWNDMTLFAVFGSRMIAGDFLSMPTYIELDTLGGYPMLDQLIGYLNYGAFFPAKDGYAPVDAGQANTFQFPSGFTAGSMQNLYAAAAAVNPAQIAEQVGSAFYTYAGADAALPPAAGETRPLAGTDDIDYASTGAKYSFVKAPRYGNVPCEVGPLARMINSREPFIFNVMKLFHDSSSRYPGRDYQMTSVYTRVLSRMQEALVVAKMLGGWIAEDLGVDGNARQYCVPATPRSGRSGACLIEASRGALGHWVKLDGSGRIEAYQIVAPTTWNASPRDGDSNYGPMELATIGSKITPRGNLPGQEYNPLSIYHIIRSFDPCVACAVHAVRVKR